MLVLYLKNIGNFQIGYKDSIVFLTLSVSCYYYICIQGFLRLSSKEYGIQSTLCDFKYIILQCNNSSLNKKIWKQESIFRRIFVWQRMT
jgi:hypothetical protein